MQKAGAEAAEATPDAASMPEGGAVPVFGEGIEYEVGMEGLKAVAGAALGNIPFVGLVAGFAAGKFLDWLFPTGSSMTWDQIKERVEGIVKEEISKNNYENVRNELKGIADNVGEYSDFAMRADLTDPKARESLRTKWHIARGQFNASRPKFQAERDAVLLAPLFVQLANLEIMVLRDALLNGEK